MTTLKSFFNKDFDNIVNPKRSDSTSQSSLATELVEVSDIVPGKWQSRKVFCETEINELAGSIEKYGILQPLVLQKRQDKYHIIAGERRWRACKKAGVQQVPAVIRNFSDEQCMAVCLVENLQRANLSIMEEAEAYQKLINELHLTHEQVSIKVGKSRAHISNLLRVLSLPNEVQECLQSGEITLGHAKLIASPKNMESAKVLTNMIREKKMSVRDLETHLQQQTSIVAHKHVLKRFDDICPVPVAITIQSNGKVRVDFSSIDAFSSLLDVIENS